MGWRVEHSDVQISEGWGLREYMREINIRLRNLAMALNYNADDVWDDLRFPASGINPAGPASPPGVDATIGGLLFDAASVEVIAFQVQMPHAWKEGSEIRPHVHWQKTTSASGTVMWRLSYRHVPINGTMPGSWTQDTEYQTVAGTPDTNTADKHLLTAFDPIDMTGYTGSHMMMCMLERVGNDATYDTYGADARLMEIDFHYQIDSRGSRQEYRKD